MSYVMLVFRRNAELFIMGLSVLLCAIALFSLRQALSISQKPLLIAIDSNGTRIVTKKDDPIFETEAVQFIKSFVSHLYNFTPTNFVDQVGEATGLMNVNLWQDEENKILEKKSVVERDQISMVSRIKGIYRKSEFEFNVVINSIEMSRLSRVSRTIQAIVTIQKTQRSEMNPYGLEVTKYDEAILR